MKTQFLPFAAAADRLCGAPKDRGAAMAAAIATALACAAALPTSPVESAQDFYNSAVRQDLEFQLNAFNENLVFDAAMACGWARQIWVTRYRAAHPALSSNVLSESTFFETLFGVPLTMAPQDVAVFNANKNPILHLAKLASEILVGLKQHG